MVGHNQTICLFSSLSKWRDSDLTWLTPDSQFSDFLL